MCIRDRQTPCERKTYRNLLKMIQKLIAPLNLLCRLHRILEAWLKAERRLLRSKRQKQLRCCNLFVMISNVMKVRFQNVDIKAALKYGGD